MGEKTTLKRTRVSENSDELTLPLGYANRSEDPLSNYVVLQNIFSYLDNTYIESCCQVNQCWNSIADRLVVSNYNVSFPRDRELWMLDDATGRYRHGWAVSVHISKPPAYDSKVATDFNKSLNDAIEFFEAVSQNRKVAINCCISWFEHEIPNKFLTKFGNFVTELTVTGVVTTRRLCETLARCLPNLQVLELSLANFKKPNDLSFHENLMANRMKRLKLIGGFYQGPGVQTLIHIFRMAPNLKEIPEFPMLGVDALIETGKGHCVKSFRYDDRISDEEVRTALEKLGNLELKLKSFDFWYKNAEWFCNAGNQPFVRRILESSRDSLETLRLHKTETFDFHAISPLKTLNLNTVQFWLPDADEDCFIKFFSPETILSTVFPKVSNVEIQSILHDYPAPHIARWFPENQFALWGIQKLKISWPKVSILRVLSRAFPALTHLELLMGSGGLHRLMRSIGEYWPEIEFLTIEVPYSRDYCAAEGQRGWSIDSLLTGIPQNDYLVLHEGTGPLASEALNLSKKQENWKERQPLRKLSKLKVLKYDLTRGHRWGEKFMEGLSNMTLVSEEEFGVQFPPELKTVVRTNRHVDSENWQRVLDSKADSERFVNFKLEMK